MQQSQLADNQQGHALSYVLGVYFGDACIDKMNNSEFKRMRLRVIDKDFIDYYVSQLNIAFPEIDISVQYDIKHGNKNRYGKKPMHSATVSKKVPEYIELIAGKRTMIPNVVYESEKNTRAFIEGILDSEGWVSVHYQDLGRFYLQVGFAMTSEIMYEAKKMLSNLGVRSGKVQTKKYKSGKVMKTILFNTTSFIESGLGFHIERKQNKINAFIKARQLLKDAGLFNPNGASFNDYKREFRQDVSDVLRANV